VVGSYFHSVTLDKEKCKGCTNCIKRCPTEAIRVREGRAVIIEERCIDCGECVRTCPNLAKSVITDGLDAVLTDGFEKRVVMPAPSFYGQFKPDVQVPEVLGALTAIGFDGVYEVARAAEFCTYAMRQYITDHSAPRPLISAACPAIVRLIQVRFPALLKHLMLVESPMEVAARLARERMVQETGLSPAKIGCYFITPCPAKVTAVRTSPMSAECCQWKRSTGVSLRPCHLTTHLQQWNQAPWGSAGGKQAVREELSPKVTAPLMASIMSFRSWMRLSAET